MFSFCWMLTKDDVLNLPNYLTHSWEPGQELDSYLFKGIFTKANKSIGVDFHFGNVTVKITHIHRKSNRSENLKLPSAKSFINLGNSIDHLLLEWQISSSLCQIKINLSQQVVTSGYTGALASPMTMQLAQGKEKKSKRSLDNGKRYLSGCWLTVKSNDEYKAIMKSLENPQQGLQSHCPQQLITQTHRRTQKHPHTWRNTHAFIEGNTHTTRHVLTSIVFQLYIFHNGKH